MFLAGINVLDGNIAQYSTAYARLPSYTILSRCERGANKGGEKENND